MSLLPVPSPTHLFIDHRHALTGQGVRFVDQGLFNVDRRQRFFAGIGNLQKLFKEMRHNGNIKKSIAKLIDKLFMPMFLTSVTFLEFFDVTPIKCESFANSTKHFLDIFPAPPFIDIPE